MKKMTIIRVGRANIIAVGSTENIFNNKEIFETKDLTEIASKTFDLYWCVRCIFNFVGTSFEICPL